MNSHGRTSGSDSSSFESIIVRNSDGSIDVDATIDAHRVVMKRASLAYRLFPWIREAQLAGLRAGLQATATFEEDS